MKGNEERKGGGRGQRRCPVEVATGPSSPTDDRGSNAPCKALSPATLLFFDRGAVEQHVPIQQRE